MEPITLLLLAALFLFGGKKKTATEEAGFEPDYQPGPVPDRYGKYKKKELVPPTPPRPRPQPQPDTYLQDLDDLISETPVGGRFWQITSGTSASNLAATLLKAKGINTGANRVRLIKCLTQIPWNRQRYTAAHPASSWGTLYDVNGENLSAAWLPRHAPAVQLLAMRESPPRTIDGTGKWIGGGSDTYFALLWLPAIQAGPQGTLICDPNSSPPDWLKSAIGST